MAPLLRRLDFADMADAALVHRRAFDAALPTLAGLHTPEEDRRFYAEQVFRACAIWGAYGGDRMLGIIAFRPDWIDQLYVQPEAQGVGIGTALLQLAQARHARLQLWTFQRNTRARRFYEARGFALVDETDGSRNEEREPDALYLWTRPDSATAPAARTGE
jgi:GNAT superfamily N-acetyltransferase